MSQETPSTRPESRFVSSQQLMAVWFTVVVTVGLTAILSFNLVRRQQVSLALGDRATDQIDAPRSIVYDSEVLTAEERQQATSDIYEYTVLDRSIGRQQTRKARSVFNFIEVVRADTQADPETKARYISQIEGLTLDEEVAADLATLPNDEYQAAKSEVLELIEDIMRQNVREDTLNEIRADVGIRRISLDLNPAQEQIVAQMAPQFIEPNVFYNEAATTAAREAAAARIEPIQEVITVGQPIIRVGEKVEAHHLEALEKLGLLQQTTDWYSVVSSLLFSFLLAVIMALYWWRFERYRNRASRYLIMLGVLVLVFALAAKLMVPAGSWWPYLFPAGALVMLLATISDTKLGILVGWVIAALVGYVSATSLELMLYTAIGSVVTVLSLRDRQRFYSFFRAGVLGAMANMAVLLLFHFNANTEPVYLGTLLLMGFVNGVVIAPVITIAGFFFVGLFGVITVAQLQDLSRLDHPLLQELLRRAPGTYHHSIMVANLAEQAAERIEANSALVRVGAFYHDIGKMQHPEFFTENQEGVNPHDKLDPYTSARVITEHVTAGMDLARHYGLPDRIRDFINEHHGDRLMKVFYERAREAAGERADEVDEQLFHYKGARPRTRETGIVLLADTIDAASTAIRPSTGQEIVKLVNSLVDDHLKEGQLDNSGLTMGDIKIIRASFIETLKGRFHVRVRYPGDNDRVGRNQSTGRSVQGLFPVSSSKPVREATTREERSTP